MGLPIRLHLVLGDRPIKVASLTAAERLAIVQEVLRLVKPHVKYLGGGKSIADWVSKTGREGSYSFRRTPREVLRLGGDLETNRHLIMVCEVERLNDSIFTRSTVTNLLLTTVSAELVEWTATYNLRVEYGHGYTGQHEADIEEAESSIFVPLSRARLQYWLTAHPVVCVRVLEQLHRLMVASVDHRRRVYESSRELEFSLGSIGARISE